MPNASRTVVRPSRRSLQLAALALALVTLARPAHADERSDARRHFRAGLNLIGQQHYPEGIAELEAAYAILPHPNVLYNIARAYNDMGNTERAVEYLRRYLQNDVPDRSEVEAIIARLEGRLRQQQPQPTVAEVTPTPTPTPTVTIPTGVAGGDAASIRAAAMQLLQLANQVQGVSSGPPGTTVPVHTATAGHDTGHPGPETGATATAGAPSHGGTGAGEAVNVGVGAQNEDVYEERVVTASRVSQSPLDAPNATGIITAQDIRLSGLTSIPDLLRRLAGVDVMVLDSGDAQVSIRGFNQRLSNKVLVLVDGRSVYLDFLGITLWPTIFPAVEEIERIEVIRGPGSALYGADAFTGVINIITRPPGESRTQVSFGGGDGQHVRGAFLTSGRQGPLSYRASLQYEQAASYDRPVSSSDLTWRYSNPSGDIGMRSPRFMIDLSTRLARDVVLRGGLGGFVAGSDLFSATGLLRRFWADATFLQPYVQLDAGGFTGRLFWNRFQADAGPLLVPIGGANIPASVQQDVVDLDLQYAFRQSLGIVTNTLQVGAGSRLKHISWNYLDADHTLLFGSAYLQDTLRIGPRFSAVASARVDYHPVLPAPVFSPRAALIFKPTDRDAIRLTAGTAFRTPTFLESYFDLYYPTPIPGVTVRGEGSEVARGLLGTPALRPETAQSVDLGYQNQMLDRLSFEFDAFFMRAADLINLTPVILDPLPGNTTSNAAINLGTRYYANDPGATYIAGGEVGVRLSPIEGLDLYANYTYAYTWHDSNSLLAATPDHGADQRAPQHKFNVGAQLRTRFGLDVEAFFHYVSQQTWIEPVFDPVQGSRDVAFTLSDYYVLNARVGYRLFNDRLDLGVTGTNLTDVSGMGHLEHPFGARITARVMGTVSYRF